MKIIVGLGNPGRDYDRTRHNIGFIITDALAARMQGVSPRNRFRSILREGALGAQKAVVAQPQMYMNLSGIPVRELVNWYKANLDDLLIVYDDMDLPLGQLRLRADGAAGGHNGMKSIVHELGTQDFGRLRIGIGRGPGASTAHVLSRFTAEETTIIEESVRDAVAAIEIWSDQGMVAAMNIFNKSAIVPVTTPEVVTK